MSILGSLFRKIAYGGSTSLTALERRILEAVASALSTQDKETLQSQVETVQLIQREQNGRMVLTYFEKDADIPLLQSRDEDHCLAKVTFTSSGRRHQATVMTHKGRLSSLEFSPPQPPTRNPELIEIISVETAATDYRSISEQIDREEHG